MELSLVQTMEGGEGGSRAGWWVMTLQLSIFISKPHLLETVGPVVHPSTQRCKKLVGFYLLCPQ